MAVDDLRHQRRSRPPTGRSTWTAWDAAASLPGWVPRTAEALALVALALVALRVRHPSRLFTHQFWLDESWVADSTRASWAQLRQLTSSTPIGWTALLRAVPRWGDPERYRLLPLAFAVAGAVPAWFLGRQLVSAPGGPDAGGPVTTGPPATRHRGGSWVGWLGPSLAGLAAVLAPTALGYPYLKQYTAEAFTALLLVALVAWVERRWSPGRLVVLSAAAVLSFLVAHTALFVTVAGFGGLALTSLARRAWPRLGWVAATGAVIALTDAWIYRTFVATGNGVDLQRYWKGRYIPSTEGWDQAWQFVAAQAVSAIESLGMGPWPLAVALMAAGVVALWRAGAPAAALVLPILVAEVVVAALQRRYPFFEPRTSMFLTVLATVVAALGVAAVAGLALRRRATALLGLVVLVGAGALFLPEARQAARIPMFDENTKGQVRLVQQLRRPGDVVVLGSMAAYQWAYYGSERPTFVPASGPRSIRFEVVYPGDRRLLVAKDRTPRSIREAIDAVPVGTRRVWVVHSHEDYLIAVWARTVRRAGGRLAAPLAHPCAAFTEAQRARAGISPGECPLLVNMS
jgi:hypothetical protein